MKRNIALTAVAVLIAVIIAWMWWPQPTRKITGPSRPAGDVPAAGTPGKPVANAQTPAGVPPVPAPGSAIPAAATGDNHASPAVIGAGSAGLGSQTGASPVGNTKPVPPGVQEAMIDLDKTRRMIRDYRTLMGENPVGTNAEIMKAVMGGNPRQATLGPAEGQQLNSKGELLDQWGTPYFFHQLSGTQMEIHSAGPDKIMGTGDDLILK